MNTNIRNTEDQYGGKIGLITFGINILVSVPVLAIYLGVQSFYDRRDYFSDHIDVLSMFILTIICHIGIIWLAVDTGSDFWIRQDGAVKKTKRFMYLLVTYWVVVNYLPFFAYIPPELKKEMGDRLFNGFKIIVVFASGALVYLNKSKAVHQAFGTREEPDNIPPVA